MKKIRSIIFVCLASLSASVLADSICDYYTSACKEKLVRYDNATKQIDEEVKAKKITEVEAARRVVALAKDMYPEDALMASITAQQAALAEAFSRSKMSEKDKSALELTTSETFIRALAMRTALFNVANQQEQALNQYANQAQQAQQAYNVQESQDQSARNTIATSYLLNGIGRAFSSSFGQSILPPPQICNYYGGTRYCY